MVTMTNTLKPLVVITGASSGIGLATAKLLSSRGHALLLLSRRLAPMEQLQLPNTLALEVDITDLPCWQPSPRAKHGLARWTRSSTMLG